MARCSAPGGNSRTRDVPQSPLDGAQYGRRSRRASCPSPTACACNRDRSVTVSTHSGRHYCRLRPYWYELCLLGPILVCLMLSSALSANALSCGRAYSVHRLRAGRPEGSSSSPSGTKNAPPPLCYPDRFWGTPNPLFLWGKAARA
jgi:hypothetical protein